ncbi:MAG TPA: hypothetical protein VK915_04735 [Gaiellaceae bacterium]|nr:hypothetical protein [Gaiellaceae bacterium]
MPSRKQRRRREKLKRHEYEYVLETEEGEEIPLESPRAADAARNGQVAEVKKHHGPVDRRGRPVPQPSLRRVLRRTAIFAPLIAIFIYVTTPDIQPATLVFNVVLLLAFFMPFSYVVDLFVYRMMLRRWERDRAGGGRSTKG